MACSNVSFDWVHRSYQHIAASVIRSVSSIETNIGRFSKAPFASKKFPPDQRITIPSTKSERTIRVNVYKPPYLAELEARKESEQEGEKNKYAVHINLHGSAWIMGSFFESDAEFCRAISGETGAIVLDCNYAKAPKHSFPAAYEDASDLVAYVLSNQEGHYDTSRLSIGGFSTGGALALIISATVRPNTFKAVTAFYPMTNMNNKPRSNGRNPLSKYLAFGHNAYMPRDGSRDDPRLSPHNNPASAFPNKVLLIICEYDSLHDEEVEFARMLKEGGKDVEVMDIPGVGHGWDKTARDGTDVGEKRVKAYDKAVEVLRLAYKY